MQHLFLFFFFLSLMFGLLCGGIYGFLYYKLRIRLIKYHLYFLASDMMLVFFLSLLFYDFLNIKIFESFIGMITNYVHLVLIATGPLNVSGVLFYRELLGKSNKQKHFTIFSILFLLPIIAVLAGMPSEVVDLKDEKFYQMWLTIIFVIFITFSVLIYNVALLIRNYKNITEPIRKYAAKLLLINASLILPLAITDYMVQNYQVLNAMFPSGILLQPLTFFILNFFSVLVLLYAKKISAVIISEAPLAFVTSYKITEREKQIIELVIKGMQNKEIASRLFLSPSTVRNHLSHIFEKTNIKTRTQLIHLIEKMK
ncbi:MAG: helix-turn-helix transcriptional regulator [Spirochaetia bacterium]|nr:helix-turn-helix transcriptional regulator [Spirochaetia bacterium]